MGCCEKFVKGYLYLGCLFDVALGIACIVLAAKSKDVDRDLFPEEKQKDAMDKFALALYVLGGVTIATGFLGVYGFIRKNRCLQFIFIFLNIVYLVAFGAIAGVSIYAKKMIDEQMTDEKCTDTSEDLGKANETFKVLKKSWCVYQIGGLACPCYVSSFDQWTADEQKEIKKKNGLQTTSLPTNTESIEDCLYFKNTIKPQYENEITLLKAVERNFQCTGVCEGDLVYYFNNINDGRPETNLGCYKQVRDRLIEWSKYIFIISLIIAVLTFLNVFLAFVNCCIGNKKDKKYSETKRTEQY